MRIGTFVLVLALSLGLPVNTAQSDEWTEIAERLARATTLRCRIDPGTSTEWEGDPTTLHPSQWGEHAMFHVDALNVPRGTARIIGGVSGSDARVVRLDGFGLHLIERTGLGMVFYTVFAAQTKDRSALIGVMSRHMGRLGAVGPVVSQWPLRCEILP